MATATQKGKTIPKEVLEDFHISTEDLVDYKNKKIQFSGEICWKCKIYVNVPRLKKTWKCFNCKELNKFDPVHRFIPFLSPDAGPTRKRIDAPRSYSCLDDRYKDVLGGEFW